MKKIVLSAAIVAAAGLASCTAQAPKANLKSDIDSLSYMMGVSNTQDLRMFAEHRMGIDSLTWADFINGIEEGINKYSKKERAYNAGVQIGQQLSADIFEGVNKQLFGDDSTQSLNKNNFLAGFFAALRNNAKVSLEEAQEYANNRTEAIKAKAMETKYAENKAAGEKFLEENKAKEGVVTTESGLQYKIIKAGKGEIPTKESTVKVNYKGTLIDGTEFDSSYKRNTPATFRANQVIAGWTEALTMMPVGSKWELYIPQELAYGARETGGQIKPFSTLIFEVELLEIEKKK
ncbi:MAG: FKBP-type peptidyl-prolyl cis-trans isomerase [Bacteroidaceae bacterium]|nr:FKBP-type peptidyl-prolyl cis-trans isomerase [Bacteroidaceae bacterium]